LGLDTDTGSFWDNFLLLERDGKGEGATESEGYEKVVGSSFKATALLLVLPIFQLALEG